VGLFAKKPSSSAKMRTVKVSLGESARSSGRKSKAVKKASKPMSFTQWIEHYAKMSGGNPV
jgi:hypothetical protein